MRSLHSFPKSAAREEFYLKISFFYDMFHPNNTGHTIMADCLQYLFERCDAAEPARVGTFVEGMTEEQILSEKAFRTGSDRC